MGDEDDPLIPITMTKAEFVMQYCRRAGVAWADIKRYRMAVPTADGAGWMMVNVADHENDRTIQGPLEPLPE